MEAERSPDNSSLNERHTLDEEYAGIHDSLTWRVARHSKGSGSG